MNFKIKLPKIDFPALRERLRLLFEDQHEKALKGYLELERETPDDMRVKQKIAELAFKKGDVETAVQKFQEMAAHFEKEEFILKAIKAYKNILKIKPTSVDINLKLAALFLKVDMIGESANQYRIAVNFYAVQGNAEKTVTLAQELVTIDPSISNHAKLAEIYQSNGLFEEAVKQYEILARDYRSRKMYDKLLNVYERILPHRIENKAILKDVCILYLRQQKPERALKTIDLYKRTDDPDFEDLIQKSRMMIDALKRQKK